MLPLRVTKEHTLNQLKIFLILLKLHLDLFHDCMKRSIYILIRIKTGVIVILKYFIGPRKICLRTEGDNGIFIFFSITAVRKIFGFKILK